ncbi:MAG: O-antigen ligase family protein [Anaerolineae bacterium]|nr:O-antigen ligase family protein [Anaerolineae bacterium]
MRWSFIWQETITLLLLIYGISIAGTINGLITPTLEMLTFGLLLAAGIGWFLSGGNTPLPAFGLPMLAYGGALAAAAVFSADWRRSLIQIGYWAALTASYLMIADLSRTPAGLARLKRAYVLTMIFIVGISFFQLRNVTGSIPRPPSILGNANLFATTVMIAIFMAVHGLKTNPNRRIRFLLVFSLMVLAFPFVFTASRTVWVSTAAGLMVYAGLTAYQQKNVFQNRQVRITAVVGLVLMLVAAILFYFFARNLISGATHGTLETRESIWQAGWQVFTDRPLVGSGPFTFGTFLTTRVSTPPESAHAHPHNIFLYAAAEAGLLGLAALTGFAWVAVKKIRASSQAVMTSTFLTGLLLNSLLDTPFLPSMIVLYFLVWTILNPEPALRSHQEKRFFDVRRWLVPSLILLAVGIGSIQISGELAAERGIDAAKRQDWLAAAAHFQRAAELDPRITAYSFQMAYAYGQAGIQGDDLSLARAIYYYQETLKKDPNYAVHWANLAILEAHVGRDEQALIDAQKAAALAPQYRPIASLPLRLSDPSFEFVPLPDDARITGEYSWYFYHVPGIETPLYPLP